VPHHLVDDRVPGRREVFLADADRAADMLRYAGYTIDDDAEATESGPDVANEFFDDAGR
jgi:hypothetical protein